jgi:hypothetical protein
MDQKTRIELIRQGNQAFNEGDYRKARDLFTKADYKDGLIRIGDYYMFEKRLPLLAYGYYKRAGAQHRVDDLQQRMVMAMRTWLGPDKMKEEGSESPGAPVSSLQPDEDGMVSVPVNPILKQAALRILEERKKGG